MHDETVISQVRDWLDSRRNHMVADLTELCNQNSGSQNLAGLRSVADWLVDWMALPAQVQRIPLSDRRVVTDQGQLESRPSADLLRWDYRPDANRRVLLAIHYDTVFGPDSDFQSCTSVAEDRLRGPGVADAKGGIVVLRAALQALTELDLLGDLGWSVILNPDEELGSPSSTEALQTAAEEFQFGLLFEPALPTGELVSVRKGSGNFDVVVRGKSAHAGRHFEDGRNAVAALSKLLTQLDGLNGKRDGATINVGFVHGGGPVNVVPDLAVGRFNVRVPDASSMDWFEDALTQRIQQANLEPGFQVETWGGINSPPKTMNPGLQRLMEAVDSATRGCGQEPVRWRQTGGVCDGNKLAAAGLTNIDTMGPIGDGLHSDQEWVQISSLTTKALVVVGLLRSFASGQFAADSFRASAGPCRD